MPAPERERISEQGQIQRRLEEKPVKTDAVFEPQQVARGRFDVAVAERELRLVLELLLRRQCAMRYRGGLECQRGRHSVLILAELIGQRGPIAGDALIL